MMKKTVLSVSSALSSIVKGHSPPPPPSLAAAAVVATKRGKRSRVDDDDDPQKEEKKKGRSAVVAPAATKNQSGVTLSPVGEDGRPSIIITTRSSLRKWFEEQQRHENEKNSSSSVSLQTPSPSPAAEKKKKRSLPEKSSSSASIWCITYKKGHPNFLPFPEVVKELLCWGWIDGRCKSLGKESMKHLIGPRRMATSTWSGVNKKYVDELRKAKEMTAAGEAAITAAKKNGMWEYLDDVEGCVVPNDLAAELDVEKHKQLLAREKKKGIKKGETVTQTGNSSNAKSQAKNNSARETWDSYPRSIQRMCLYRIKSAKTNETRSARILEVAKFCKAGQRPDWK